MPSMRSKRRVISINDLDKLASDGPAVDEAPGEGHLGQNESSRWDGV